MAEQGEQSTLKKEYLKIENKYLTLFEQRFIGGSEIVDGKFYDLNTAIQDYEAGKGILPDDYSKTLAQLRDGNSLEDISRQRREHSIVGMLSMFGVSGVDVFSDGYEQIVQLPVAHGTGSTPFEWEVFLHPLSAGISDLNPHVLSKLQPTGKLAKILHSEVNGNSMHIRLKTWKEYNEV